jgi:phage-related protein (TIGR01555 family)
MVSRWVEFTCPDEATGDDKIDKFNKEFVKKYKVKRLVTRGVRQMFMHGGSALYIDTNDANLAEELNKDVLKHTFLGFKFVDQGLLMPVGFNNTFNFDGPNFNIPDQWQIVYPNGRRSTQIHRTRFIFFIPEELPFSAKINQLWWGNSTFVPVHDDINNAERAFKSSGQLITQGSLRFLKTDMRNRTRVPGAAQNMDVKNKLFQKAVTQNGNAILLDKEDEIEKLEVGNLKSQAEMIIALVNKICASDGIPLTIYWGNPQTGFSSGDAEIIHFQGSIAFKQECYLDDPMEQLIEIGNIVCFGKEDVITYEFNPIYESTESQKADVGLKKAQRRAIDITNGVPVEVVLQETSRDGTYPDMQFKDCAKYAKEFEDKQLELAKAGQAKKPGSKGFDDKDIKDGKETNKKPTNNAKTNQPENVVQKSVYK